MSESDNEPLFDTSSSLNSRNETVSSQELAKLDEETKACIQMQDIESSTVEPGKIMVEVKSVATSEDNERIAITTDHPVDGEVMFHLSKPRTWDPENELVQFLGWYDLSVAGIYQLQTHDVCIRETDGRVKGWELCEPPGYTPDLSIRERVSGRIPPIPKDLHIVSCFAMGAMVVAVTTIGTVIGYATEPGDGATLAGATIFGLLLGLIGALLMVGVSMALEEFIYD